MKNKIILIGGYCAAGKSTFARKLSQELNIPYFEKDTIDETLCDGFGREKEIYKLGSENVAFDLMLYIVERFLRTEKACILENVFNLGEIERIKKLFIKYNCTCLLFVFKGDPEVMFDRYVERDATGERHWIHGRADKSWKNWFRNDMPKMYKLEEMEIGQKIIVDTTSFDKINYDDLYTAAKRFIID